MLLKSKSQIKNYFIFVILLSLSWVLFIPFPNRAYGILILMIAGFPIFGLNHYFSFFKFSSQLKLCDPFLFNSYSNYIGPSKGFYLNGLILLNEKDRLKSIRNEKFQQIYGVTHESLKYTLYSFFSIIILGILMACL